MTYTSVDFLRKTPSPDCYNKTSQIKHTNDRLTEIKLILFYFLESLKMFGPLTFPQPSLKTDFNFDNEDQLSQCLLCEQEYNIQLNQDEFLAHLFKQHQLIISDVHLIANLRR